MRKGSVIVKDPQGLHMRSAAAIARTCRRLRSRIRLSCENCRYADGCSILELLLLEAKEGTRLDITAEGADEEEAVRRVKQALRA